MKWGISSASTGRGSGIMIGRQVDRSARTVHGRLPFTAGVGCAAATGSRKPFLGFMSVKL
jgi:hypothetical protein